MRKLEYRITEQEAGQSVEQFLKKRLQFGKKQISRLKFREGGLELNGQQCRSSQLLKEGDLLCIRLDPEGKRKSLRETYDSGEGQSLRGEIPEENRSDRGERKGGIPRESSKQPVVLYEDEDLLAVYKPGGLAVHPGHGHYRDTLWNQIISLQESRKETWTPRIAGRLDRDTSGIILLAKNTEAAAALAAQRQQKQLRKIYTAEAEGLFQEKAGSINLPIEKDPRQLNRMRTGEKGLPAVTHYRVLGERQGRSLLQLELEQGRTHQIRVHLASLGHPLTGDVIYNPKGQKEGEGLRLHAGCLQLQSPFTGKQVVIQAPDPSWMKEWMLSDGQSAHGPDGNPAIRKLVSNDL